MIYPACATSTRAKVATAGDVIHMRYLPIMVQFEGLGDLVQTTKVTRSSKKAPKTERTLVQWLSTQSAKRKGLCEKTKILSPNLQTLYLHLGVYWHAHHRCWV